MLGNLQSYSDEWRLESSTETLLTVLQTIAAGIALIYCCPQIVKGSSNIKLLKHVSINIRSYLHRPPSQGYDLTLEISLQGI